MGLMEAQLRLLTAPKRKRAPRAPLADRAGDDAAVPVSSGDPAGTDATPALEPGPTAWRLSASTRAVGRQGIQSARAALRDARPRPEADTDTDAGSRRRPAA
jgi:hypothetical protein